MSHSEPSQVVSEDLWLQALEQAAAGYLLLDADRRLERHSASMAQVLPWQDGLRLRVGASMEDLFGVSASDSFITALLAATLSGLRQAHQSLASGAQQSQLLDLPAGRSLQAHAHALPQGRLLITYREQAPSGRSLAEFEPLTFLDPLTRLPNRRLLLDRLAQAILQSQRTGWLGALMLLDLEQLRAVQKSLGQSTTERLTLQIGSRLLGCVRASDTVARVGNEAFVVMVSDLAPEPGVAATLVQRIGDKVLRALEAPYVLEEHTHHIAASIGCALFGPYSHSATELLHQAEAAMFQLLERSGSGLCFFDAQLQMQVHQRSRMEADLRQALEQSQFEMHYQPQYAPGGEVIGLEALLRWRHPEKGLVPPTMFIAVAEESDIIVPLGSWALKAACLQLAQWQRQPDSTLARLPVSVNISPRQLLHPKFVELVQQTLQVTGAPASQLVLELPEAPLHQNAAKVGEVLRQLKSLGLRIALDNFGTGELPLTLLPQMPLDQLKIARSLVQRLAPNNASEASIQALLAMADNLELQVVAEGVETLEQRALLQQFGCQSFQGYLFSQPMAASELQFLLASSTPALEANAL